jgi:beta-fructofuranosidase
MRRLIVFQLLFLIVLISGTISAEAQANKGLSAFWGFDESSGKLVKERVSGQQDSVHSIFNTIPPFHDPLKRKGIKGEALVFDGNSNFIAMTGKIAQLSTNGFTISVWIAPRAFEHGDGGKLSAIINQQDKSANAGFALGMFRHGTWSFQVGTGDRWIEVWDEEHLLPKGQWSFLTASYDPQVGKASLYLNGRLVSQKVLSERKPLKEANVPLMIGKHNQSELLDKRGQWHLNMFNGLMDELSVFDHVLSDAEISKNYHEYLATYNDAAPSISFSDIKLDRTQYRDDPNRPQYHAIPPGHWMNEPHAPFFYKGKYHLTYQHNPTGPFWHQIHWGHWVSDDLVHWYDAPDAISPRRDTVAPDGIWTGSASVDKNGDPVLIYTFGNWNKTLNQGVAMAFPKDIKDPDLKEWIPYPKTTVMQAAGQGIPGEFRDPFVWKDKESGKWLMLVGSGIPGEGGTAWCYESENLYDWKLKGPFYKSNYTKYPFLGSIWELPVFLPVGKYQNGETRYVMICSPKGLNENVEIYYWLGKFDRANYKFIPDDEEPRYWDYGIRTNIGPSGMIDPRTGRALIFAIAAGGHGPGWANCASFPMNIFLNEKGELGVKPINELNSLRKKQLLNLKNTNLAGVNRALKKINGDMLEIEVEMQSKSDKFGILVRKSPGNEEKTLIFYDAAAKQLGSDLTNTSLKQSRVKDAMSGTDKRPDRIRHFDLQGQDLSMRIYLDKSLIQAFANDSKMVTSWIYPSLPDAKGLSIWSSSGDVAIKSIKIWEIGGIYPPDKH